MLGLHYVPGGHGSPVCPKCSAPWDFGQFFSARFTLCSRCHGNHVSGHRGKNGMDVRQRGGMGRAKRDRPWLPWMPGQICSDSNEAPLPGPAFYILPPRPRVPCQTVVEGNDTVLHRDRKPSQRPGCTIIERNETATIHPSLPWGPWQNVAKWGRKWQNLKGPWDARGIHMLPVPLRTAYKFCYGLLHTVKFCWVHPILLWRTRFLIHTMTAVANVLTVSKSGPASTAITACHVCPSRPPALSHIQSCFVQGGLKCECRGQPGT